MDLQESRKKIDKIDDELVKLFEERMAVSAEVAEYKRQTGKAVLDPARERAKMADISSKSKENMRSYMRVLYSLIFELSRAYQCSLLNKDSELYTNISKAIDTTPKVFPKEAKIACQGVEGAYSQAACQKLFAFPDINYYSSFRKVFTAIESGECDYGILPLENSTAGSVNKVYDLMIEHKFHIVRSVRVKIDHSLMAKKGTKLSDIKEIISHEQALNQCSAFISSLGKNVKVTAVENTAKAAETVSKSEKGDIAAICSKSCQDLYGLECLQSSIQDAGNNHTRFICISKKLEIYPGADRTSLMLVAPHSPGSLYRVLARFYALGINLQKLESRPIPNEDFEFMFYFDLDASIYSPEFIQLMCELDGLCDDFKYLGSYTEII